MVMGEAGWRDHSGATVKCGARIVRMIGIVRMVRLESLKFLLALKAVVSFGIYFKWPVVYLVRQRGVRVLPASRS